MNGWVRGVFVVCGVIAFIVNTYWHAPPTSFQKSYTWAGTEMPPSSNWRFWLNHCLMAAVPVSACAMSATSAFAFSTSSQMGVQLVVPEDVRLNTDTLSTTSRMFLSSSSANGSNGPMFSMSTARFFQPSCFA